MSIVGDFTKGAGQKVSTSAAKDAEDPDWEPQADDKEAAAAEKAEKAAEKKREREEAKANKAADAAVRQTTKKKAKTEPAESGSSAPAPAKRTARKAAAPAAAAPAPAPAAGKKRGRARSPSPPPPEESDEDDDDYDQDGTDVVRTGGSAASAAAAATAAAAAARPSVAADSSSSAAPAAMIVVPSSSRKARKADSHRFHKDLPPMMYGYGDARTPLPQTVQMMEELVVDYITEVLRQAAAAAEQRGRATRGSTSTRVKERDLLFVLRKDRKRLDRVLSLLEVYEEQKEARGKPPEDFSKDDE